MLCKVLKPILLLFFIVIFHLIFFKQIVACTCYLQYDQFFSGDCSWDMCGLCEQVGCCQNNVVDCSYEVSTNTCRYTTLQCYGADCSCSDNDALNNSYVKGSVTVEGQSGYAGPNGSPIDPLKSNCDGDIDVCCSSTSACSGACVRCGDYMPGACGDLTTYGISGTNSLSVIADSTRNPNWVTKVNFQGTIACNQLAKDTDNCAGDMCTGISRGPLFDFGSFSKDTAPIFMINTSTTDGYVPVSMSLTGATTASINCDGSTSCSLTATLNAGSHDLAIVIRKASPPLPCANNFSVACNSLGTQATINWDDLAGAASYLVRLNRDPYSDWANADAGDQGLPAASSNITANITPDYNYQYDVQGIKPGESYPYSGARCPFDIFNCPSPKGTIRGSIINYAKEANSIAAKYIDAALPACGGNEVLSVPVNITGTQTVATSALLCDTAPVQDVPYFIESLKLGTYSVTATVPAGWQAVSWQCVSTGTSCPSATGAGNTISGINLTNTTDQTWIFFRIQPIPPRCTISGSTTIVAGETGTFIASETVGGIVPNVQMKKVLSTCLATNTCISSATLLASSNCVMVGCPSSVSYSWITTEADMTPSDGSQPWYFYCQGYNGAINLTSRQCRPFNPYAYPWDLDCVAPAHVNICDPNSGTDCIKVNVTEPPPWYQVWGGDVHAARGDLTSYLPIVMATDDPAHNYFNLNAETLLTGFPGLVSLDSTYLYDFASGAGDSGTAKSSTKKWLAKSNFSYAPSSTEDSVYDYYLKKLGNPAAGTFDCSGSHNFNNLSDVQIIRPPASAEGCSITGNWNVTGGSQVIVLVDTALNILDQNTRITVDEESFLAFIAKDGINIDKKLGVKQEGYTETPYIQGVYMTDGQIDTGFNSEDMSGRRFIGAGMFYAKDGFVLARDLKDSPSEGTARNWNTPAELFIYRPDLAVNSPSVMWSSEMDWQEVAP